MTLNEIELIEKLYAALRIADDIVYHSSADYETEERPIIEDAFDAYEAWNEPRIDAFIERQKEASHG